MRTWEDAEEVANSALYDHLVRDRSISGWTIIDAIRRVVGVRKKQRGEGLTSMHIMPAYRPLFQAPEPPVSGNGWNAGTQDPVEYLEQDNQSRVFSGSRFPQPDEAYRRGLSFRHGLMSDVPEDPAERLDAYARFCDYEPGDHADRVYTRAKSRANITQKPVKRLPYVELLWDWITSGETQVEFAARHGKHPGTLATQANALGMSRKNMLDPEEKVFQRKKRPSVLV